MLNMYASWMPDAPQLNNTWGQLNAVLNWCLVDDGEEFSITSIENTDKIGILKVNAPVETSIKFVKDMTVSISGSFYPELTSKPFLIVDNGLGWFKITRKDFTTEIITDTSDTLTIKRISSGMKRLFGGVEEKKTIFQTGDDKFCLRIDDTNPTDGGRMSISSWTESWNKMGRVMISNGFNSLDEINGYFAPYANNSNDIHNMHPSGNYNGWSKWYYNPTWSTEGGPYDAYSASRFNNAWAVFANDKVMYLIIYAGSGLTHHAFSYMFGEFESNDENFPYNCILASHNRLHTYNQSTEYITPHSQYNTALFQRTYYNYYHNIMLRSYTGVYTGGRIYPYSFDFGSSNSGGGGIQYPNPQDNMISLNDIFVYADSNLYGKYIGVKWISHYVYDKISNGVTFKYKDDDSDKYYKYMILTQEGNNSSYFTSVMFDITK